jgi:L-fuconolactonase
MNMRHHRRQFLATAALGLVGAALPPSALPCPAASPAPGPTSLDVIDTHVHFYDPTRPQGVPWPPKDDRVLYRKVLPSTYTAIAQPRPVAGVIVVEASPWIEDNQWILDLMPKNPIILGLVGSLPAGKDGFATLLRRFAANPGFRGIRIRPSPPRSEWDSARLMTDLKALAGLNLSLDLVGGLEALELARTIAAAIPDLRIVIDHLAGVQIDGNQPPRPWLDQIRATARHHNVYMKISGLVEGTGQRGGLASKDPGFYQPTLDAVWDAFGADRLLYGSNWTVCEHFSDLATVQRLPAGYFSAKGTEALHKVMSANSQKAYQWAKRKR